MRWMLQMRLWQMVVPSCTQKQEKHSRPPSSCFRGSKCIRHPLYGISEKAIWIFSEKIVIKVNHVVKSAYMYSARMAFCHQYQINVKKRYWVQKLIYQRLDLCKIASYPLLMHWRYCSLALSHRYSSFLQTNPVFLQNNHSCQNSIFKMFNDFEILHKNA